MSKLIGEGIFGKVYLNGDTCTKYFKSKVDPYTVQVLSVIKNLKFNSIYKILEFIYSNNEMIGYTMKYYSTDIDDIFEDPKYLIESYYKLREDSFKLQRNNIYLADVHSNNIIKNKDGLIFIDCDDYIYSEKDYNLPDNDDTLKRIFADYLTDEYLNKFKPKNIFYGNLNNIMMEAMQDGLEYTINYNGGIIELVYKKTQKNLIF